MDTVGSWEPITYYIVNLSIVYYIENFGGLVPKICLAKKASVDLVFTYIEGKASVFADKFCK